jgi:hypothetical protein
MRYLVFFFLASVLSFSACVVPAQMPRVTLSENFTQSFSFDADDEDKRKLTKTLSLLIGADRVDQLITSEEGLHYINQMKAEKIIAKGIATLTFSLVPGRKPSAFYISGTGSYNIIDTSSTKVYFSANFYLIDTIHYPISLLETDATIPLYFNQVLINHVAYEETHSTWEHSPVEYVKVDAVINRSIRDQKGKAIFGLDYHAKHRISIKGETIGYIQFNPPQSPFDKIIDIRGIKSMIRRDYHKYKGIYESN